MPLTPMEEVGFVKDLMCFQGDGPSSEGLFNYGTLWNRVGSYAWWILYTFFFDDDVSYLESEDVANLRN